MTCGVFTGYVAGLVTGFWLIPWIGKLLKKQGERRDDK